MRLVFSIKHKALWRCVLLVWIVFPVFLLFLVIDKANQKLPQKPGIDQSLFRWFGKFGSIDDESDFSVTSDWPALPWFIRNKGECFTNWAAFICLGFMKSELNVPDEASRCSICAWMCGRLRQESNAGCIRADFHLGPNSASGLNIEHYMSSTATQPVCSAHAGSLRIPGKTPRVWSAKIAGPTQHFPLSMLFFLNSTFYFRKTGFCI